MSSVTSTSNNLNDNSKILVSVLHAKEALEEMSNMEHMDSMCRMEHKLLRKHSIQTPKGHNYFYIKSHFGQGQGVKTQF